MEHQSFSGAEQASTGYPTYRTPSIILRRLPLYYNLHLSTIVRGTIRPHSCALSRAAARLAVSHYITRPRRRLCENSIPRGQIVLSHKSQGAAPRPPRPPLNGAACAPKPPTDGQTADGGGGAAATASSSTKARIMLRAMRFGMSVLLSSVAPVDGEVSLVRSHSVMASRS